MLAGAIVFAVFSAVTLVFFAVSMLGSHELLPRPEIAPVDELALVNEDRYGALCDAARALGYRPVGTFSFAANRTPKLRAQSFVTGFLSPDGRTQLEVQLVRNIAKESPVSSSVVNASAFSFAADGRVVAAGTAASRSPFKRPRFMTSERSRLPLETLLAAHERLVVTSGIERLDLEDGPDAFERRLSDLSARIVETWREDGYVRPDGVTLRPTLKLVLRSYALFGVLPGGHSKHATRALVAFVAVALAAVGAAFFIAGLDESTATKAACGLFAATTALAVLGFEGVMTWAELAAVIAVAFHALGVTTGLPWIAALVTWALIAPGVMSRRAAREEALFASAEAKGGST